MGTSKKGLETFCKSCNENQLVASAQGHADRRRHVSQKDVRFLNACV